MVDSRKRRCVRRFRAFELPTSWASVDLGSGIVTPSFGEIVRLLKVTGYSIADGDQCTHWYVQKYPEHADRLNCVNNDHDRKYNCGELKLAVIMRNLGYISEGLRMHPPLLHFLYGHAYLCETVVNGMALIRPRLGILLGA